MELIYITRPLLILTLILAYYVWKYRKPLEDGVFRTTFKFRGTTYGFTYTADEMKTYSIQNRDDPSQWGDREYWHQIWLGFYRRSLSHKR